MTTRQIVEKLREIEAAHDDSIYANEDSNGNYPCFDVDTEKVEVVTKGLTELLTHFEHLMGCTQWAQKEEL